MSGEDGPAVREAGVAPETGTRARVHVDEQLESIRFRGGVRNRFTGLEIIGANLTDVKFDLDVAEASGDKKEATNLKRERGALNHLNGIIYALDSEYPSETITPEDQHQLLDYFEGQKKEWDDLLEENENNIDAKVYSGIYKDILADLKKHLPHALPEQTGEAKDEHKAKETKEKADLPTLKDLLKDEVPFFIFDPGNAKEEMDKLIANETFELNDIESYAQAEREAVESFRDETATKNPAWEKYQPAIAATKDYFDNPENADKEIAAVAITVKPDGDIDVRSLAEEQLTAEDGSEQFVIDLSKDETILRPCIEFDKYDRLTAGALRALHGLQRKSPITKSDLDRLIQLPVIHQAYVAEKDVARAEAISPVIGRVTPLILQAKPDVRLSRRANVEH